MSYKLFWAPDSGALVPHIGLEVLGLPYEKIVVDTKAPSAELLAVSPMKQVPVLVFPDGHILTESAAMMLALDEKSPGKLFPKDANARADAYRWLLFLACNCYETILRVYYSERYTALQTPEAIEGVKKAGQERILNLWKIMDKECFKSSSYMVGKEPGAIDFTLWMLTNWLADQKDEVLAQCPKVAACCDLVRKHPSVDKIYAEHYP